MILTLVAAVPPTIAALAALVAARRDPRGLASLEAKVDDLLSWQVEHERDHIRMATRRRGGMQ